MKRCRLKVICCFLMIFHTVLTLSAEHRVALVIGNGMYPNAPLTNPPNDAADMAKSLEELDFSVVQGINVDYRGMISRIRDFHNMLTEPDTVALFYYSGHGLQIDGKNYLIPANTDIQSLGEVEAMAVQADLINSKLQSGNIKTSIIILDACRNNPFFGSERSGERGLSVQGKFPPQAIVVYATGPNQTAKDGTGRNGTFTESLLRHLRDPMDIEIMLRTVRDEVSKGTGGTQIPWTNSSLTNGFTFVPDSAGIANKSVALSLSGLPPGTMVSVDGKSYLTTLNRDLVEVGRFAPGDHTLSLSGQYIDDVQIPVSIEKDKPLVLFPEVNERGKVKIQSKTSKSKAAEGTSRILVALCPSEGNRAETKGTLVPGTNWEGMVPAGNYALRMRREDDIDDSYTKVISVRGGTVTNITIPDIGYSVAWQINDAKDQKINYEQELSDIAERRRGAKRVGWAFLGLGVLSSAVSITAGFFGYGAYSEYQAAVYTSDAASYRKDAESWSKVAFCGLISTGISFLISPIAFHAAPDGDEIEAAIERLDQKIETLSRDSARK